MVPGDDVCSPGHGLKDVTAGSPSGMVRGWLALARALRRGRQPGLALDVADGRQDGTRGNLGGLFGNEGPRQQRRSHLRWLPSNL